MSRRETFLMLCKVVQENPPNRQHIASDFVLCLNRNIKFIRVTPLSVKPSTNHSDVSVIDFAAQFLGVSVSQDGTSKEFEKF